ncbi:hypothetical protein [Kribbella antiqua]|uniref:hypothetical protein n=1 Tax=Kribbella antiqua TaxID=2512217 RepID=UPI001A7E6C2E|nr:hypothetical protein [Kribbella antiqua]
MFDQRAGGAGRDLTRGVGEEHARVLCWTGLVTARCVGGAVRHTISRVGAGVLSGTHA